MMAKVAKLVFEVPGEPQGKGRAISGRGFNGLPTHRTPPKTKAYEAMVQLYARQAMAAAGMSGKLLEGPLWLHITAFCQIPASASKKQKQLLLTTHPYSQKKPDWDNTGKICADAMNGLVYRDDAQIADARVIKRYAEIPRVVISIGLLDGPVA